MLSVRFFSHMNTLLIFLKYPAPGAVKTRLAESVGQETAAQVYKQLVEITLEQVGELVGIRTIICFDPPEKSNEIKEI